MSHAGDKLQLAVLQQRLAEAEATIRALVDGQVDAVLSSASSSPILLQAAQEAMRASEERYRRIVETTHEGVWIIDRENTTVFVNAQMARMLGYTVPEMLGRPFGDFMDEDGRRSAERSIVRRRQGIAEQLEARYRHRHGTEVWVLVAANPLFDATGAYDGAMAMVMDITDRKRGEAAMRMIAAIVESSQDAIFSHALDGTVLSWNSAAERIFGFPAVAAIGQPISRLHLGERASAYQSLLSHITAGQAASAIEMEGVRQDGTRIVVSQTVSPITDARGQVTAVSVIARDITQRKRDEDQRRQRQKLETIGRIAAGVAHDINTPMQFIADNLHFLGETVPRITQVLEPYRALRQHLDGAQPELTAAVDAAEHAADIAYYLQEMPRAISQSLEGTKRIASIVRALRHFTHPGGGVIQEVDLRKDILVTLEICYSEYHHVAEVVTDFAPDLPLVRCIGDEIGQVVLNLVVNAAQAIAERVTSTGKRGTITIAAKRCAAGVEVRISDTGKGIPPEIAQHIFEPFFTTKGLDQGTGQGLYLAHEIIVKHHGGTIRFESDVGKGTTFFIVLPLEPATVSPSASRP